MADKHANEVIIFKKEKSTKKLDELVENVGQPLLQLQTSCYLLLNLIPDILTIDNLKLRVRYRSIFDAEQVQGKKYY